MTTEVALETPLSSTFRGAGRQEGFPEPLLRIGHAFRLSGSWQIERFTPRRPASHLADRLLVENEPRLGHANRHHRDDLTRETDRPGGVSDLTAAPVGRFVLRIPVNEDDVRFSSALLREHPLEAAADRSITWRQSGRIDRRDRDLAAVRRADDLEVTGERKVRGPVGEEETASRHATSNSEI